MKALRLAGSTNQQQDNNITQLHFPFPLLHTKLLVPPMHPKSISRPHLIAELDKGVEGKLTLISAPTGFGKTTLLSEWAYQSERPVLWISLSESDNDPTQFWTYLLIALASLSEPIDPQFLEHFSLKHPQVNLAAITNMVASISQEFVLVLDDYQNIHNPEIHTAFISLLEFLPLHMRIFLSSRTRPPLPLPRLRASRQLHEIHPEDLLFRQSELENFLAGSLEEPLPAGLAATIAQRTGGWIAILHLLVIWLQEQRAAGKALDTLPEKHPYILEYLVEEVLQHQPAEIQTFLLQTSILNQLNSTLCDVLTENSDSLLILEQIERANLFLSSTSHQPNWYLYQPLIKNFLQERLEQLFPEQVPLLHRRASAWYEEQQMYAEAIMHLQAIPDIPQSIALLYRYAETMLMHGEINGLLACLQQISEHQLRRYPLLCQFYAWSLILSSQFDSAARWIGTLNNFWKNNSCSQANTEHDEMANAELTIQQGKSLLPLLNTHFAIFRGDIKHLLEFSHQESMDIPHAHNLLQQLHTLHLGLAHFLKGKPCTAETVFTSLTSHANSQNNVYITLAASCGLLITHMRQGKYQRAFEVAQQALYAIEGETATALFPFSAYLYTETSYLLYEWNRLDEAAHYAQQALAYGEKYSADVQIYSYVLLSLIRLAQGDLDEADRLLQQAKECKLNVQCRPWTLARMAKQAVRLALLHGDIQQAEYHAHLPDLHLFSTSSLSLAMSISLAKKQPQGALELVQASSTNQRAAMRNCTVMLLQVRAHQDLGEETEALRILDKALRLMEPEGRVRQILDVGPPLLPLLRRQLQQYEELNNPAQETREDARLLCYVRLLLDTFADAPIAGQENSSSTLAGPLQDFSKREIDIIQAIATGLSNQEIAQKMIIAESTVKWYVKNIYSKLDVHNRAQAIVKIQNIS